MARNKNRERRMSLGGHLKELRRRLFFVALFIVAGSVGGWYLYEPIFAALSKPVIDYAKQHGTVATVNLPTITAAFDLQMQVSIFAGVIISSPFWLYQLWAFISPALQNRERRFTIGFMISAIPLFFAGCALAWVSFPAFITTLLSFTPSGSSNLISAQEYVLFVVRVLLVFGLAFVLPVVLVMLNLARVLSAKGILKGWRIALLTIAIIAALATPVADPMSMFLVMIPMLALYFASAAIAAINDRVFAKRNAALLAASELQTSEN